MQRLLLLADEVCFEDIKKYGGLPPGILCDVDEDGPAPSERHIVRRDPALLIPDARHPASGDGAPDAVSQRALDEEGRDELFAELLGTTVCHLVVLGNARDGRAEISDKTTIGGPTCLEDLVEWYKAFQKEVGRVRHRRHEYQHILILVCTDDLRADDLPCIKALTEADGEHAYFHRCYVMLKKLELGRQDVCFSRYVWPSAVGRLLLRLLDDESYGIRGGACAYAWRAFELSPGFDRSIVDEQYVRALGLANQRLCEAGADVDPEWRHEVLHPREKRLQVEELGEKEIPTARYWHRFGVREESAAVTSEDRWSGELTDAGESFGGQLAEAAIESGHLGASEDADTDPVKAIWGTVHPDPRILQSASRLGTPDLGPALSEINRQWKGIQDCEKKRQALVAETETCVPVLEDAQRSFVELGFRLVFAFVVSLLVGYGVSALLYAVRGAAESVFNLTFKWLVPAGVAVACVGVTALVAAIIPYFVERYRGENAVARFIAELGRLDDMVRTRNRLCQESLATGFGFWEKLRTRGRVQRLKLLMRRAARILDHELQPVTPEVEAEDPREDDGILLAGERDRRQRRQRRLFRERMLLQHPVQFSRHDIDRDQIDDEAERQIRRFRDVVWLDFCGHSDPERAGNLPAHVLIPVLRDFCEEFREAIMSRINTQAMRLIKESGVEQWIQDIRTRALLEENFYYMSCQLAQKDIEGEPFRHRLLVQPDFEEHFTDLAGEGIVLRKVTSLGRSPVVGYLFSEVPIHFGASDQGYIEVTNVCEAPS